MLVMLNLMILKKFLTEYVSGGTDMFEEWQKKTNGVTSMSISQKTITPKGLDSTGRGRSELYKG